MPYVPQTRRLRRGLSLIELAIVLGIIGLVLGAIWVASAAVYTNMKVSQSVNQLMTITQNVRILYKDQNKFGTTGDLTEKMVQAHVFPEIMLDTNENPRTLWGTPVRINIPANTRRFQVIYDSSLPQEICRNLAGRLGGAGRTSGLTSVTAAGRTWASSGELNNLSPTSLGNGACTSITFTFNLKE